MNLNEIAKVLRVWSADAVELVKNGHPGAAMGCAEIASALYFDAMRHNPENPSWANRDRFIMSNGHASVLLYAALHLAGYDVTMEDLRTFRQLGSKATAHPEYGHTAGVETTTGPLGQGIANAVGMAIGERMAAARFNRPGYDVVDHYTYVLVGDGDLMEGISAEASSFAGHLGLGKLIAIYDSNQITIEGSTDITFTESVKDRYLAYGWQVLEADGHDLEDLRQALEAAKGNENQPTLIIAHTQIAKGAPTKAGLPETHGSPLGEEEVRKLKQALGFPEDEVLYTPEGINGVAEQVKQRGQEQENQWQALFEAWSKEFPELRSQWDAWLSKELPDLGEILEMFPEGTNLATRAASGKVLNAIAKKVPNLVGGSADLSPSNQSFLHGEKTITRGDFSGRNFNFGVREHAMGAILNGLALYGHFRVYGATFLVFSDYLRHTIRLSALMNLPVTYIFTHDSPYVGEDGPTHQPVETTESLRLIPNLTVFRPADAEETAWSWVEAMRNTQGPTALILSRQTLPALSKKPGWDFTRGGYIVKEEQNELSIVLVAAGSEVSMALEAAQQVEKAGYGVRVVSMPNRDAFLDQDAAYKNEVVPEEVPTLAVEFGVGSGWYSLKPKGHIEVFGIKRFGVSGSGSDVAKHLGFTVEALTQRMLDMINN
ncbi:MAG: transketolase [Bacillota bacterium]|nr:transketolase [Bacillota bacterium]